MDFAFLRRPGRACRLSPTRFLSEQSTHEHLKALEAGKQQTGRCTDGQLWKQLAASGYHRHRHPGGSTAAPGSASSTRR